MNVCEKFYLQIKKIVLTKSKKCAIILLVNTIIQSEVKYLQGKLEIKTHTPHIGEVYAMNFCGSGNEQSGWRPGVIFQNNIGNAKSPNVIALPLTTSLKKLNMPTHVLLKASDAGLKFDSMVICENPEKMSKEKIGKYITTLSEEQMKEIAKANLMATAAISFLDEKTLLSVWKKSMQLNAISA